MYGYYLNIGLWHAAIGFACAIVYFFVLRQKSIGSFWGALLVAIIGAFLGALIDYVFKDVIYYLSHINDSINMFPPIIATVVLLWIFSNISRRQ